ncbi:hypothetical protein Anas_14273 [Armadillidium nasatum]|uniref:Uncharacterized protein n=1 Tax=Armadillidium nasatum TaxID=96803 RepID=A0A5N5T1I5_9CRUS|nr:hypothetical protein Anas_14273 [Armadillidium nasatum]
MYTINFDKNISEGKIIYTDGHEICFVCDDGFRELSEYDPESNDVLNEAMKGDKSGEWFAKKGGKLPFMLKDIFMTNMDSNYSNFNKEYKLDPKDNKERIFLDLRIDIRGSIIYIVRYIDVILYNSEIMSNKTSLRCLSITS